MPEKASPKGPLKGTLKSLGLVFGDIGTSPIYTLTVIFLITDSRPDHVIGVLSLIVWTLILLVTVQYAWLAMSLGKRGEGGTIVLRELLTPLLKSGRQVAFVTLLSFIGISLIIGDGVITPAISILSAVEGLRLIPGLADTSQTSMILIAGLIAIMLFSVQKKGTERIARAFGPLMVIWFVVLTLSGVASIVQVPSVVKAVNPWYAFDFLLHNGIAAFFVLSEVILCATGRRGALRGHGPSGQGADRPGVVLRVLGARPELSGAGRLRIAAPRCQERTLRDGACPGAALLHPVPAPVRSSPPSSRPRR